MSTMNGKDLVKDEWIGRTVTIADCKDPQWTGTTARIIDETKHTFLLEKEQQRRRIAKRIATFTVHVDNVVMSIDGTRLAYRPEDRIKKAR